MNIFCYIQVISIILFMVSATITTEAEELVYLPIDQELSMEESSENSSEEGYICTSSSPARPPFTTKSTPSPATSTELKHHEKRQVIHDIAVNRLHFFCVYRE